jgi:hypothetical protein
MDFSYRAERKAGELLPEQITRGGDPKSHDTTLKDLNISRDQSSNWQRIAEIPEDKFEKEIRDLKACI